MPKIDFLIHFLTGQLHLIGIDNNDKIPHILMGSKRGFMLTLQYPCHLRSQPAQDLIFGIHDIPFPMGHYFICF